MNSDDQNQRIGAFVTNKWLVGALLGLVMGMGGYIITGLDLRGTATAMEISGLRNRITTAEIALAMTTTQYQEIIRRLDRIEASEGGKR